jgi:hypothetical protein
MFDRIARGWNLGITALHILRQDKKLLIFPLLSGLACLFVMLSFAGPIYMSENARKLFNDGDTGAVFHNTLVYVVLFAFYFVNYLVIVFFNSALVACAMKRFRGEEPTLGGGFSVAMTRLPQIVAWSLLSATVGVILRAIEDRSEKIGTIVAGLLGMAWNVMTFFVLPVLVIEGVGPFTAIKRSCAVLKKAWGESLVANFGTGLLMFVFSLLALIPGVLGFFAGGVMFVAGICLSVLLLMLVSLISSATNTIILAALYQYATQDSAPKEFNAGELEAAFVRK